MTGRPMANQFTERRRDDGQIAVLVLGLFVVVLVFILGAIDVTSAQLARMRLLDTADSIALGAADALDTRGVYGGGLEGPLVLTDESVHEAAQGQLARTPRPPGISGWSLRGHATLPMTGWILESLGGEVTITVTSRARASLD